MLPQKQAEEAIVSNFSETEHEGGGKEEGREDEQQQQHSMLSMKSFLWHGGSAWDAWFSCASNQVPPRTPHFKSSHSAEWKNEQSFLMSALVLYRLLKFS